MSYNLDAITEMIASMENTVTGHTITTGLPALDACMDLPETGGFAIILGERGCGKTTLLLEIAHSIAVIQKWPILLFSGGLPKKIVLRRFLSQISDISVDLLRKGKYTMEEFAHIQKVCELLVESPLHIIDELDVSFERLMDAMENKLEDFKPRIILIDNVPAMNEDIRETAVFLKQFSEFMKVPVIAVFQCDKLPSEAIDSATIILAITENGTQLKTLKNSYGPLTVLPLKECI